MEIKRGFNRFVNVERFEEFLRDSLHPEYSEYIDLNIGDYLDELAEQNGNTGSTSYELGSYYTKSRRLECFSYDVEYIMDADGENVDEVVYTF